MQHLSIRLLLALVAAIVAALALAPAPTYAHETRAVGDYTLVVGFIDEPAIQGETNGIWLRVTRGEEPVSGLADTLSAEITYGDQTRAAALTAAPGEEGTYTSVFIPTEPGGYTFRFAGKIGDLDVNETFTSSPESFDSVAPRGDFEFPTAANGSTGSTLAYPAAIGAAVLAAGVAGAAIRRARR